LAVAVPAAVLSGANLGANGLLAALASVSFIAFWISLLVARQDIERLSTANEERDSRLAQWLEESKARLEAAVRAMPGRLAEELDLAVPRGTLRQAAVWSRGIYDPDENSKLDRLIRKYTVSGKEQMGGEQMAEVEYPIDFMESISDATDTQALAALLCSHLAHCSDSLSSGLDFQLVASPFTSNQNLVYEVSKSFNKNAILVNPDQLIATQKIFGTFKRGQRVLFVHDVIYTGSRVRRCIEALKKEGLKVEHALVLVERTDSTVNSRDLLSKAGVSLHSMRRLSASDLRALVSQREGSPT
jgi:orotate phosphoribosyltransferase